MEQKYLCSECANSYTPLCEECGRIYSPSGKENPPTLYVALGGSLTVGDLIGDGCREVSLEDIIYGEYDADELISVIEHCLIRGRAVPLSAVIKYNLSLKGEI